MKSPVRSKTLWASVPTAALYLGDAIHLFLQSGTLDNICAQKSALAGGLFAVLAILRFRTHEPITQPKEGLSDDRSDPKAPD